MARRFAPVEGTDHVPCRGDANGGLNGQDLDHTDDHDHTARFARTSGREFRAPVTRAPEAQSQETRAESTTRNPPFL